LDAHVVYSPPGITSNRDSVAGAKECVRSGAELIIFAGGDGTARDVNEGVGDAVPLIGIPAGVKMHSAVFLNRPEDLGPLLASFAANPATKPGEIMDIDEDLFRKGIVTARLFAMATTPDDRAHVQAGKSSSSTMTAHEEARDIATFIADEMREGTLYIIGPGSTTAAIGEVAGFGKTLLGVDAVKDGSVIKSDASEKDLLVLLEREREAKIIVSPIGAQGFFFGRGNQQISSRVIRTVGKENIIVAATPTKLAETPVLRIDTGDPETDSMLKGRIRVVTGYGRRKLVEVS
jgi:predicted polyphosphate/ATP-dependent NAD kinase